MKRIRWAALVALLAATACSQADERFATEDMGEPPNVSPTAAPGVAFEYRYAFQLADRAIADVQEKHASRCEAMGVSRCRITGLRYSVNDDDDVSARLQVKLAPEIARQFGKEATADVTQADGRLSSTEFLGTDTEPLTTEAGRQQSDIRTRIADIEKQLATATRDAERAQLQSQLNELRSQLSQVQSTVAGAKAQLASTPMTFDYYGRGGISGFKTNPVREAAELFISSFVAMITFVLRLLALLLPWAVLVGLLVLLARSSVGRAIWRFFTPKHRDADPRTEDPTA